MHKTLKKLALKTKQNKTRFLSLLPCNTHTQIWKIWPVVREPISLVDTPRDSDTVFRRGPAVYWTIRE